MAYIEFNNNTFLNIYVGTIANTFSTPTPIYLENNYVNTLYNRLRHFMYFVGPSYVLFENFTITNVYSKSYS